MPALHSPHLPRLVSVSVAAFALAVTISLALASSLSNINQTGDNASISARHSAPAAPSTLQTTDALPGGVIAREYRVRRTHQQ